MSIDGCPTKSGGCCPGALCGGSTILAAASSSQHMPMTPTLIKMDKNSGHPLACPAGMGQLKCLLEPEAFTKFWF